MERERQMQEALQAHGVNGSQDDNDTPPMTITTNPTSPRQKSDNTTTLTDAAQHVLSLFGRSTADTLLSRQHDFFAYTGLIYPTEVRVESYYFWAAYLTPMTSWSKVTPWDPNTHTHLKSQLEDQVKAWVASFTATHPGRKGKELKAIQSRLHVFDQSWDLVARENAGEKRRRRMDEDAFLVKHTKLWDDVKLTIRKALFEQIFMGSGKSPCTVVEAMNNLTLALASTV
jgi:hypothetical protein